MALNYSHRPIFPAHMTEDNLVTPMRMVNGYLVEGMPERKVEGCTRPRHVGPDLDERFDYGRDRGRANRCASPESVSKDIIDLLPSDPFGMDISTTMTAITGWLEDLELDCAFGRSYMGRSYNEDYALVADLNMIWNNAIFQSFPSYVHFDGNSKMDIQGNLQYGRRDCGDAETQYGSGSACNEGGVAGINYTSTSAVALQVEEKDEGFICSFDGNEGNQICNNATSFQLFPDNVHFDDKSKVYIEGTQQDEKIDWSKTLARYGSGSASIEADSAGFDSTSRNMDALQVSEGLTCCSDQIERNPYEAVEYAFSFLGVKDLLSVGMVSRQLYGMVHGDNLLWRSIHIGQPLNEKITDDILFQLTSKAEGKLESLSLVECPKITDDGLKRVLEANSSLTKLCVPGCTRLSIAGVVNIVKAFNSKKAVSGIKHLRIGGLYGITNEHFEELICLLGVDTDMQQSHRKPRFYHRGNLYLLCDDDCAIDVETCPRCEKLRMVYDCPAESCQMQENSSQICRACTLCIPRCIQCGRCINDNEYEETFCLELLCSECFKQLPKFQDKLDQGVGPT